MSEQRKWRKSSYSGQHNNCVEIACFTGIIAIRDSKHPDAVALTFADAEWSAFVWGLQAGDLK
ncbi:DUF397 domain-containing protein [Nocardiopsis gilva YIM 90087]|uniref:DUF397 domain-containing protein n=1 Tax=Nocardiopsis gilva YIM 90087 TaxID=1235441 RepID=A0A223SAH6_9ACTN|nr:DUF397 domain-containing protein [Nocardiopsis gilva]ASU85128.1 DUF397 domain-containing protein [Nocardiopsis gilva YIM 90087]